MEITSNTGWLSHTARARLTDLRKRGFKIEKTDEVTHYSMTEDPNAHCANLYVGSSARNISRGLMDMASECDDGAREPDNIGDGPPAENRLSLVCNKNAAIEPLIPSIRDTARVLGPGRSTIYRLIADRQLETVKVGNRPLTTTASIRSLAETRPE